MDRFDPASAGSLQAGYRFGEFRLETDGTLARGDAQTSLPDRELVALRLLLEQRGRVVTLQELKQALWPDEPATVDSVSECIASLRKFLEPEDCIEAIQKRGFRFSAAVEPFGGDRTAGLPRLAILPFATGYLVPDFLGSAIVEETHARLGAARPAPVEIVARDSVFALARRGLAPQQIGKSLRADYVLSGALHLLHTRYRLRVQMIRVEDGAEIWVEERLVDQAQWVRLESELARLILRRMRGAEISTVAPAKDNEEPPLRPEQQEAYEVFARACYEWHSLERHRMQDAVQQLLRAIELDPSLIAARSELAYLCVNQAFYGFTSPAVAVDLVRRAADGVADLPAQAEAMLPALGWIRFHFDRNLSGAVQLFARAAHLPHDPWIMRVRILFALSRHRFGEAADLLKHAIGLDPWSPWLQARLAWTHHLAGDAAASIHWAETAIEQFPGHEGTRLFGAIIFGFNGETGRAISLAQNLAQRQPYFDPAAAVHAYTLAVAGRAEETRSILERQQWLGRERYAMTTFTPAVHVVLGELDLALEALRTADQMRCPWFFQMLADPRLKPLHEKPEFQAMQATLTGMEAEAARMVIEE